MTESSHQVLREIAGVRSAIRERVLAMNAMSEREVLAAGRNLDELVRAAREHVELIRDVLHRTSSSMAGSAAASGERSADLSAAMGEFLTSMIGHLATQRHQSAAALSRSTEIGNTAKAVASLARAAHALALNAKIETARLSSRAGAFSALSSEMQRLSQEVQSTNAQISSLAGALTASLPQVSDIAVRMQALTEQFSSRLSESMERAKKEERALRDTVTTALRVGDDVLAAILGGAGESLSHLQFQDSTAQGLREIDAWLYELEGRIAQHLGLGDEAPERVPPIQLSASRGADYDRRDAGLVTLL